MRWKLAVMLFSVFLASCTNVDESRDSDLAEEFRSLEQEYGVTMGVYAVDVATGESKEYRSENRFAYASTMKALAAGVLMEKLGTEGLLREVPVTAGEIVPYSPILEGRVGDTVTLAETAEAAVTYSDNTAGNKIFAALGGADGLQKALRERGDNDTVVCHIEPKLNEAVPDEDCDTTTARSMTESLRAYLLGDALDQQGKDMLRGWMEASTTGASLIPAGLPEGWGSGDKSGMGLKYGARGDTAILFPPADWSETGGPVMMTIYTHTPEEDGKADDQAIADAAAVAMRAFSER